MRKYDPARVTRCHWYRDVGILEPRARWVPPLGPVGPPLSMGNSTKGDLYTYIHTMQPMTSEVSTLHSPGSTPWMVSTPKEQNNVIYLHLINWPFLFCTYCTHFVCSTSNAQFISCMSSEIEEFPPCVKCIFQCALKSLPDEKDFPSKIQRKLQRKYCCVPS